MSAQVTHDRTDVPDDSGDEELIQPSDWLADHDVRGVLEVTEMSAITVSGLLADRALIVGAPEDMSVLYAGVMVGVVAALDGSGGDYLVRIWHEADWTLAKVSPAEGVVETRMAVHQQAIWASLVVLDNSDNEYGYRPWAANTGMPGDAATSGSGSLWVVETPGTSGATPPDWSNPVENTVQDGTVTWLLVGDAPASGTIRPYLLTFRLPAP